jgi:cytochrome c
MNTRTRSGSLLAALMASAMPLAASASLNLALDKGCLGCHGTPPRGKAPTMAELATRYATVRGNEAEIAKLSDHLREHHLFGTEEAERFVRWLVDGGR